eukprot:SAG22_NODE_2998_length_2038_cov_1.307891_2_plen_196_part_00
MRVLVVRIRADKLTLFWPIVVAEMVRVLGAVADFSPQVVLAVFKLLDLLVLLQPAAFRTHEWMMFIFDDAERLEPEHPALASGGGGAAHDKTAAAAAANAAPPPPPPPPPHSGQQSEADGQASPRSPRVGCVPTATRRPLFSAGADLQIHDVAELRPYAAQLRLRAYENSVSMEPVDYGYIERYLEEEFVAVRAR